MDTVMFLEEELQFIEKEMNTTIEFCCGMLVKGDDKSLEYDLKMAQQVIEKVRTM